MLCTDCFGGVRVVVEALVFTTKKKSTITSTILIGLMAAVGAGSPSAQAQEVGPETGARSDDSDDLNARLSESSLKRYVTPCLAPMLRLDLHFWRG